MSSARRRSCSTGSTCSTCSTCSTGRGGGAEEEECSRCPCTGHALRMHACTGHTHACTGHTLRMRTFACMWIVPLKVRCTRAVGAPTFCGLPARAPAARHRRRHVHGHPLGGHPWDGRVGWACGVGVRGWARERHGSRAEGPRVRNRPCDHATNGNVARGSDHATWLVGRRCVARWRTLLYVWRLLRSIRRSISYAV